MPFIIDVSRFESPGDVEMNAARVELPIAPRKSLIITQGLGSTSLSQIVLAIRLFKIDSQQLGVAASAAWGRSFSQIVFAITLFNIDFRTGDGVETRRFAGVPRADLTSVHSPKVRSQTH